MLAPLDRERHVVQERASRNGDLEALGLDHDAARALRLQELEPKRAAAAAGDLDAHLFQAVDLLQLRLRLPGLRRLVAEPLDEALEPRELLGLALGRAGGVLGARGLLAAPDVPFAREVRRLSALQLEHRRRHGLEKPAVVGDEDDRRVDRAQQLFEPFDRLDVEVVGRLVEQQQVRLRCERARE